MAKKLEDCPILNDLDILRHFDESPQLPNGYAGMVLLALVPPLWRWVMDDRVRDFHAKGREAEAEGTPLSQPEG